MPKTLLSTATVAALAVALGGCAAAGSGARFDERMFDRWDLNRDGLLDATEFDTGWTAANRFAVWDRDRDGFLDENEWNVRARNNAAMGPFAAWDADRDNRLDPLEFRTGAYEMWDNDRDTRITRAEWIRAQITP
ncbi:MAG: hypothetical protein KY467_13060 [Gemmatimonadetes bacterium]|nr:hypothetical protein [Gemmatimonadota bacterium]